MQDSAPENTASTSVDAVDEVFATGRKSTIVATAIIWLKIPVYEQLALFARTSRKC
jgi:hypothetical protein